MVTDVITNYLDNDKVSKAKKVRLLKESNLSYCDVLQLSSKYVDSDELFPTLYELSSYSSNRLSSKLKRQNKKRYIAQKNRKIRKYRRKV